MEALSSGGSTLGYSHVALMGCHFADNYNVTKQHRQVLKAPQEHRHEVTTCE
jgi:hypothetical protein